MDEQEVKDLPGQMEADTGKNIVELPDPVVHPLKPPRWKKRCDSQQPKARYKTNSQKRKERERRRKARA